MPKVADDVLKNPCFTSPLTETPVLQGLCQPQIKTRVIDKKYALGLIFLDPVQRLAEQIFEKPVVSQDFEYSHDRMVDQIEEQGCPLRLELRPSQGSHRQLRFSCDQFLKKQRSVLIAGCFAGYDQQIDLVDPGGRKRGESSIHQADWICLVTDRATSKADFPNAPSVFGVLASRTHPMNALNSKANGSPFSTGTFFSNPPLALRIKCPFWFIKSRDKYPLS